MIIVELYNNLTLILMSRFLGQENEVYTMVVSIAMFVAIEISLCFLVLPRIPDMRLPSLHVFVVETGGSTP